MKKFSKNRSRAQLDIPEDYRLDTVSVECYVTLTVTAEPSDVGAAACRVSCAFS